MEENKDKRVLRVELGDDVKKVSITGKNEEEQVVMRQELDEDELDMVTGGSKSLKDLHFHMEINENQINEGVKRYVNFDGGCHPVMP
jgi:hypothetical protein